MLHITQTKQTQTHKCQIYNTTQGLKQGDKLCGTREWHGICLLCFKHLARRDKYIYLLASCKLAIVGDADVWDAAEECG
jgi:hypothetical protein